MSKKFSGKRLDMITMLEEAGSFIMKEKIPARDEVQHYSVLCLMGIYNEMLLSAKSNRKYGPTIINALTTKGDIKLNYLFSSKERLLYNILISFPLAYKLLRRMVALRKRISLKRTLYILISRTSILVKYFYAKMLSKEKIYIFGTPQHSNIGDLAIHYAQKKFLHKILPKYTIISLPLLALQHDFAFLEKFVHADDTLLGPGGGNMGDAYPDEEEIRRKCISAFRKNKIVIFPQTIHFSGTIYGNEMLEKTKQFYSEHPDLTLVAREQISYKTMLELFPKNMILLAPDIVLSLSINPIRGRRKGALVCIRNDIESNTKQQTRHDITKILRRNFSIVKITDTIAPEWKYRATSDSFIVKSKLREFQKSKIVVTDRLHGMVFAAITGTPCIALANYNHKVSGTYRWLASFSYIHFLKDASNLEEAIISLETNLEYRYDPEYFSKYWQLIKEAIVSNND